MSASPENYTTSRQTEVWFKQTFMHMTTYKRGKEDIHIRKASCTMILNKRMGTVSWKKIDNFKPRNYFIQSSMTVIF